MWQRAAHTCPLASHIQGIPWLSSRAHPSVSPSTELAVGTAGKFRIGGGGSPDCLLGHIRESRLCTPQPWPHHLTSHNRHPWRPRCIVTASGQFPERLEAGPQEAGWLASGHIPVCWPLLRTRRTRGHSWPPAHLSAFTSHDSRESLSGESISRSVPRTRAAGTPPGLTPEFGGQLPAGQTSFGNFIILLSPLCHKRTFAALRRAKHPWALHG